MFELTQHAALVIEHRKIPMEWIEQTVKQPDRIFSDVEDSELDHFIKIIPEVILDYNDRNEVVGVEILRLSKRSPKINPRQLQFEMD